MEGTNSPFSKILIIILPGGVTHSVDGFCIAAIIIPTIPKTLIIMVRRSRQSGVA